MSHAEPSMDATVDILAEKAGSSSLRRDTIRNVLRQRSAVVGLTIMSILFLVAVFAPLIAPYEPNTSMLDLGEPGSRGDPPCIHLFGCPEDEPQHLMGLDSNIRDEFSRVVHGSRVSLQIGFLTVSFAIVVGTIIGAIAGYAGGASDNVLMRMMDVVLSFPSLILAIAIVTVLGTGLTNAMLAIGIVSIPIYARVMRASVLSVRETDFVTASRALGESSRGILTRRILPNSLTPLIVQGTLGIGGAILEVAALSFVGLGAQPPTAEWGFMIASDRNLFFSAPHLIIFPGIAITLSVLAFNLIGDGLRDALDPRLNR
ncbi:MAG: ABC transporter permease [Chloroflexota bacterium]|jgi:peptide/nickel transport system permease protein|nr:ABC transporter permease [Chloroflexota bacterium]MDH5244113.1 ABC transporter permease [Chloroflexota bacterium]